MKNSFRTNVKLALQARKTAAASPYAWASGQHHGQAYLDSYIETLGEVGQLVQTSPRMPARSDLEAMRGEANQTLVSAGINLAWTALDKQAFEWGFMSVLVKADG